MTLNILEEIEDGSLRGRSVRGGVATLIAQGAKMLVRLASQILIARLLTPADYGLVAMVGPVLALLMLLAEMGLGQAVIQHPKITHQQLSSLFWLGMLINAALALIVVAISPLIALAYGEPRLTLLAIGLAALIPISSLQAQHLALLTRNMRFGALAVIDIVPPLVGLAFGLWAAKSGFSYWSLVVAAGADIIGSVALAWIFSRWRPGLFWRGTGVRAIARVGGHLTASNLANYATTTFDTILLGMTRGEIVLGLYDRGYRLVTQPLYQLMAPFGRVAIPLLIRLREDEARYRSAFLQIMQLQLLLITPGILAVMIFAKPVFGFLLGPRWEGVAPIAAWLCIGGISSPLFTSALWLFFTQGRTAEQLRYVIWTSILSVLGFVAGLPWGAVGVAAGAGLSFLLLSTPLVFWGATRTGPVRGGAVVRALLPVAMAALAAAGALVLLSRADALPPVMVAITILPIAYGSFAALLAALPSGRQILRGGWALLSSLRPSPRIAGQGDTL